VIAVSFMFILFYIYFFLYFGNATIITLTNNVSDMLMCYFAKVVRS